MQNSNPTSSIINIFILTDGQNTVYTNTALGMSPSQTVTDINKMIER